MNASNNKPKDRIQRVDVGTSNFHLSGFDSGCGVAHGLDLRAGV